MRRAPRRAPGPAPPARHPPHSPAPAPAAPLPPPPRRRPAPPPAKPVLSAEEILSHVTAVYAAVAGAVSPTDAQTKVFWHVKKLNLPGDHPHLIAGLVVFGREYPEPLVAAASRAVAGLVPQLFAPEQLLAGLSIGAEGVLDFYLRNAEAGPRGWRPLLLFAARCVCSRVLHPSALPRILAPLAPCGLAAQVAATFLRLAAEEIGEDGVRELLVEGAIDFRSFFPPVARNSDDVLLAFLAEAGLPSLWNSLSPSLAERAARRAEEAPPAPSAAVRPPHPPPPAVVPPSDEEERLLEEAVAAPLHAELLRGVLDEEDVLSGPLAPPVPIAAAPVVQHTHLSPVQPSIPPGPAPPPMSFHPRAQEPEEESLEAFQGRHLLCPICGVAWLNRDPVSLDCGHCFCNQCL
eukprot:tig00020912_g15815.t1